VGKQLLYVTAVDDDGKLVKAKDSEKDGKYYCPICKKELILKKSGKTGKHSKRPHFAHYSLTENCTSEGALHYSFKKLLLEKIKEDIKNKISIDMIWECNYCHNKHEGNLLKKVFDVKDEYDMKVCRPDIALFDEKGNAFAVIEIVVTHKPEENVIEYYKKNNIICIQIALNSEDDLENMDDKLKNPNIVDCCLNPRCPKCGNHMIKKNLIVLNKKCYRCGRPMKICYISINNGIQGINNSFYGQNQCFWGPSDFNDEEINFAKSKGAILETRFSKSANSKYLANICSNCWAFIGHFPLFGYIFKNMHDENIQKYDMGYFCYECDQRNPIDAISAAWKYLIS
jgi:hypothetical protein